MSAAEKATSFPRSKKASAPRSRKEAKAEYSDEQDIEELGMPRPSVFSPEAFDKLLAELDAPAKPSPGLVALIKQTEGLLIDTDLDEWNRAERIRS